MNVEEKVAALRASTRKRNGSFRRKIRQLYQENAEAAQILEKQVNDGNLTEHEFELNSVEKVRRNNNAPYLYKVNWDDTINGPDAFIGNESVLKKFIPEFFNKTENEIREELIKQYKFNQSLADEREYEDIITPKIRKN